MRRLLLANALLRARSPRQPMDAQNLEITIAAPHHATMGGALPATGGATAPRLTIWGAANPLDSNSLLEPRAYAHVGETLSLTLDGIPGGETAVRKLRLEAPIDGVSLGAPPRESAMFGRDRLVRSLTVSAGAPLGSHPVHLRVKRVDGSDIDIPFALAVVDVREATVKTSLLRRTSTQIVALVDARMTVRSPIGGDEEEVDWRLRVTVRMHGGDVSLSVATERLRVHYRFGTPLRGKLGPAYFAMPVGALPSLLPANMRSGTGPRRSKLTGYLHWLTATVGAALGGLSTGAVKALIAALLQFLGIPGLITLTSPTVEAIVAFLLGAVGRESARALNLEIEKELGQPSSGSSPGPSGCIEGTERETSGPRLRRVKVQERSVRGRQSCVTLVTEEFVLWIREVCESGQWVFVSSREQVLSRSVRTRCFASEAAREDHVRQQGATE